MQKTLDVVRRRVEMSREHEQGGATVGVRRKGNTRGRGAFAWWVVAGGVALFGAGAEAQEAASSGTAKAPGCVPGIQVACPCPGGAPNGVQVCASDGLRYSTCDCAGGKPALQYEYRNAALMVSGIILLGIGNVNVATGALVYKNEQDDHVTPVDGILAMGLGGLAMLLAPGLIAAGAERVPVPPNKAKPPSVAIEPTLTGVRVTF